MKLAGSIAVLLLAGAAALAAPASLGDLPALELTDQRGGRDSLAAHRGQPVLVVVVDARRMALVRRWEQQILGRYPDLRVLTVADVNETRRPELGRVQAVLARRVPPEVAVLIDLDRAWARQLELDTTVPNLVLVNAVGEVAAQFRGRWSAAQGDAVLAALAALRGES
jgi:hypothetical protein